ncbi:serine hydrolase domain-containing protein [Phytohabitans sp. ZYX-F-186]|uniref:Serine hydrolase domain-containing protein n=1 Tax=Phytohabitans maris TaxID=3071409 RepID=A0ABU0ZA92_9ACTN|nr:serine hydrolase domain-containing protein [Phytohabitans sp. ZYX-F-186]MDQ7903955.1 serine hydrolase domain-containing protein [Phytohabitans sp. ZYX-F-186]
MRERIQRTVDGLVAGGSEIGLQVCVIQDGETTVDAVAGRAGPDGPPVAPGTLFYAASTGKGVAATLAHVAVEREIIGYETRVAEVWPEFAAHGKGGVTLRDVLLHTAGVPGLPAGVTVADMCDWDRMCALVADAEPWWPPGTATGYHAQTFGYLLGETLRRASGRPLSTLLRELVTRPLAVEGEVCFGVPESLLPRVATQVAGPPPERPPPGSPAARATPAAVMPDAAYANRRDVLTSDIPSAGTMSARGVARMYAALLGHVPGVTLVSPERLALMAAPAFSGVDQVMGFPTTWAYGYSPYRPGGIAGREGSTFGMIGVNGSAAWADIDTGVAVAVMRNRFAAGDLTVVEGVGRIVAEGDR